MSTGREKDQKDFDLEQIVKVIDTALESAADDGGTGAGY